ncbi:VPLPA-CTERM sorting domain-containing protein [uncultured Tateyamaria sp.]|uniref:VPLPA-CTERM sorting domain-containing protein n=1 Tax=uncultured Tateyamaria sp. TaxID=455651 RepID=UPI002632547D|nr:VPLPA-CTERM sorting domain-containing protein [uncultured Tateyamaria sp.]
MTLKAMVACAALMIAGGAAQASTLSEDFNNGMLNGFGVINVGSGSIVNGGPGGDTDPYLNVVDDGSGFMAVTFGPSWVGDLSAFDGATFSVDYIQTEQAAGGYIESFGTLLLTGAGRTIGADVIGPDPIASWQSASAVLDAALFGVTQEIWEEVLADITEFNMRAESWSNPSETVGFDNFLLVGAMPPAVPLPAGGVLLLTGLGAFALTRRRKR